MNDSFYTFSRSFTFDVEKSLFKYKRVLYTKKTLLIASQNVQEHIIYKIKETVLKKYQVSFFCPFFTKKMHEMLNKFDFLMN